MYASRHVVYVGPGQLPPRLAQLLAGHGEPALDHGIHTPRLLSVVESAAEAEHLADALLRLKLGVLVAGPEQPPAEDSWDQARHLEPRGAGFCVTLAHGALWRFTLAEVDELTSLEWREAAHPAEQGVLLRTRALDRPVFLRAGHGPEGAPRVGLGQLDAFLHACGRELKHEARIRHQRLTARAFGAPTLEGDLLPLALGVVDAIDDRPGELPGRPRW